MARRKKEPQEALGPQIDGLDSLHEIYFQPQEDNSPELEESMPENTFVAPEPPVVLLCGESPVANIVQDMAKACGFVVKDADWPMNRSWDEDSKEPDNGTEGHNEDLIQKWGIDKNYFVCIFIEDIYECQDILLQCLHSQAAYLGCRADLQTRDEIFAGLRAAGAPDAELAAINCPMGLNIGAQTPDEEAVAIVAELLAAKNGTLKCLRYED